MLLATAEFSTASPLEAATRERACQYVGAKLRLPSSVTGPTPVRLGFGFLTRSLLPPYRFLTVNGYDGITVCFGPG